MTGEIAVGIDVSGTRVAVAAYGHPGLRWCETQRLKAGQQYTLIRGLLRRCQSEVGEPSAVGIEQPFFGFPKAAYMHGMVVGRTEDACRNAWPHAPQRFFQPSEWRRIAGVGGKASKDEVRRFVTEQFGFRPTDQDQADASAVAIAMWLEAFAD